MQMKKLKMIFQRQVAINIFYNLIAFLFLMHFFFFEDLPEDFDTRAFKKFIKVDIVYLIFLESIFNLIYCLYCVIKVFESI